MNGFLFKIIVGFSTTVAQFLKITFVLVVFVSDGQFKKRILCYVKERNKLVG